MNNKSIWDNLTFTESKQKSAYDFLVEQSQYLVEKTSGELKMEVEAVDTYIDEKTLKPAALYILYVVAPKLGNYRRKILTVVEYAEAGRFPVEIYCHLDNDKMENITSEKFLNTVSNILSRPIVKNSIENLYKQSRNVK